MIQIKTQSSNPHVMGELENSSNHEMHSPNAEIDNLIKAIDDAIRLNANNRYACKYNNKQVHVLLSKTKKVIKETKTNVTMLDPNDVF